MFSGIDTNKNQLYFSTDILKLAFYVKIFDNELSTIMHINNYGTVLKEVTMHFQESLT